MASNPNSTTSNEFLSRRLVSLDTYRGLAIFLMVAEVIHLCRVARHFPESGFWNFLCHHQSHVPWTGCSLHDLIQPSFTFMVGVALPFSIASRIAKGQSRAWMTAHAFTRALILIFLGIFLRSLHHSQTYFTFEDTLTQIGLGYGFLFLLGFRPVRDQWIALGVLLFGYWLAFALYPTPPADFDYTAVGVPQNWDHLMSGFAAHWNKNTNLAAAFDRWFLNLFPRAEPFEYNGGGYQTLSFIPTLGTMILGLLAGGVLRSESADRQKVQWLIVAGIAAIAAGLLLHFTGLCPIVKRIWTPAWTLFSGGCCFLIMAGLYQVIDRWKIQWPAFPLVVVGMNAIAIYVMSWTLESFILENLKIHFGEDIFSIFGEPYASLVSGGAVLLTFWLILFWMFRRRIFLRI